MRDESDDIGRTAWLRTLMRLHDSPARRMDRRLFWFVTHHLPNAAALDRLAALTHQQLLTEQKVRHRASVTRLLTVAAQVFYRSESDCTASTTCTTLDDVQRHLKIAFSHLPPMHASILDACVQAQLRPPIAACMLGLTEPMLHRYHTQARALLRCHPWSG